MKRLMFAMTVLPLVLLLVAGCNRKADYTSATQDIRISNSTGPADITGSCISGVKARGVSVTLTVDHGYGRTLTVAAPEVNGLYVSPQTFTLNDRWAATTFTVNVEGVAGPTTGQMLLVLNLTTDDGRTLQYGVPIRVDPAPPFGFDIVNGKVYVTSDSYKDYYDYSIVRAPYNSPTGAFEFRMPYTFGLGRTMELSRYSLWMMHGDTDSTLLTAADGWSLELLTTQLAQSDDPDTLRLRLNGSSTRRFDIKVHDLRLLVHPGTSGGQEVILEEGSDNLHFPQMRLRAYDILWAHNMGADQPKMEIGYDTLHVGTRVVLAQTLGYTNGTTNGSKRPFLYQWGRAEDGHQVLFSANGNEVGLTTTVKSNNPGNSLFIIGGTINPVDWRAVSATTDHEWSAAPGENGGVNNPCPTGYRVPTNTEVVSTNGIDLFKGFNPPQGGMRNALTAVFGTGASNYYWSCTPQNTNPAQAMKLSTADGGATWTGQANPRGQGSMVRCVNINE